MILRKMKVVLFLTIAVSSLIIVRLLKPIIRVRIGQLRGHRIGHFTVNTELYMCQRDLRIDHSRTIDLFYLAEPVCNQYLAGMWKRVLKIHWFVRYLDRANRILPGNNPHIISLPTDIDNEGLLAKTASHLKFTPDEERIGQKMLGEMGVPYGAPFVCFQSRDSAYLENWITNGYYDYHSYRNSSISNCINAADSLIERGYYAIRTGHIVKETLGSKNPMLIDYAASHRSEFMDIYLASKCDFFFGGGPGNVGLFAIFRRPQARANVIPYAGVVSWHPHDLFIPKKLWLNTEDRFMYFKEIFNTEIKNFRTTSQYEEQSITVVENTADEINDLAIEMDGRLKGTWQTSQEDEELQKQYWSLFKSDEITRTDIRIGTEFLKQNRDLLE